MAKYFLVGGKDDDLKSNYLEKTLLSLTKKIRPRILFFPTAMRDSQNTINHFIKTFNNLLVDIEVITLYKKEYSFKNLDELFENSDIIYFSGGNTATLVEKVKELKIDILLKKYESTNKIYAGISAGAILYTISGMGDSYSYMDHGKVYNYKMVDGLGMLNFYICPHYQKEDLYIFNDEIKDKDLAYGIEDDTALFIDDNKKSCYKASKRHSIYEFRKGLMSPLYEDYKIHILGPIYTYSYVAALKFMDRFNLNQGVVEHNNFRSVIESLKDDDLAIVPIENSLSGYLGEVIDLLFENNLKIIYDFSVRISFSIASFTILDKIKDVYVQFKAKEQCINYLDKLDKNLIETKSNIASLNLLLENKDLSAAIIPDHIIDKYKFKYVESNVCDKTNNYTRFVVLGKKKIENIKLNNFKCSLLIIPTKDESGLLYNILKLFNDLKINLNAIMSRPTKEGLGKYYFYVEFFSNKDNLENIIKLFEETKLRNDFKIKDLGLYLGEGVEKLC